MGELVFQKTLLSQSFIVIVISLPLMVFALIYNKKIAKFTVTFNFDNKLIVLNKYNKSIAFSEVVEILFINGKIKSTEIAEIQLITHQENFLLASYLMNISYYETIPQEILKKLESSFKLNRCRLAN